MNNVERAAEVIWSEQAAGVVKPRELAEALAEAGLLMPELPKQEEWDDLVLLPREGKITFIKDTFSGDRYTSVGAREHALNLLAAAEHVEKEKTNE